MTNERKNLSGVASMVDSLLLSWACLMVSYIYYAIFPGFVTREMAVLLKGAGESIFVVTIGYLSLQVILVFALKAGLIRMKYINAVRWGLAIILMLSVTNFVFI